MFLPLSTVIFKTITFLTYQITLE